jgi:hypothetical protein
VGEQWSLAVFPQNSSTITVNVGVGSAVPGCMDVTTMAKEQWRAIDRTDEETDQNELPRATVADPKQGLARG